MGLSDFLSDLYSSLAMTPLHADAPSGGPSNAPHSDPHSDADTSGAMNDASNQGTGKTATVQQSGAGGVDGGVSNSTPHAGTDEESAAEADVNAQDQQKAGERTAEEPAAGHKPGDGGDASGQTGVPDRVKQNPLNKMDEDDDVPEEEEDEDEEPQDLKPKLEEGESSLIFAGPRGVGVRRRRWRAEEHG